VHKRIERLAKGIFEYELPGVLFHAEKVEVEIPENELKKNEFSFESTNDVMMKGNVYSSNFRMECLDTSFEDQNVVIHYQFHSEGMTEGDILKGEFHVVMNHGEYNLPFVVTIIGFYMDSSIGRIRTLEDFTCLAQKDMQEAFLLFSSNDFIKLLQKEEKAGLLYRALSVTPVQIQKMEEFLVTLKQKESIIVSVQKNYYFYEQIKELMEDVIEIKKNHWGYLLISCETDADFIKIEKYVLTSQDFLGSACKYSFLIDARKLHSGKNFGKITFSNIYQSIEIEICVYNDRREYFKKSGGYKEKLVQLEQEYLNFRLQKKANGLWARDSLMLIQQLLDKQPQNEWLLLFKAQILIMSRQQQEAEWILDEFKRSLKDKTSIFYGYYLYVQSLMVHEPLYIQKVTKEIEGIYEKNNHTFLFLALLFLKESYLKNDMMKYKALKAYIRSGTNSPLLYVELFMLMKQNPYLIENMDDIEVKVLLWGGKYKAITNDLATQILICMQTKKIFRRDIYKLLCYVYALYPDEFSIQAICQFLIKGQCFSFEYLNWYALGIQHNIKLTNLNEAYMMSLDKRSVVSVPREIQLFYQFESNIPYTQKAVVFVNIIAGKEKEPELYLKYRSMMQRFTQEQILAGHIDDNLSIIYAEMLEEDSYTPELMQQLAKLLFVHKISVFTKDVIRIVLVFEEIAEVFVEGIIDKSLYLPVYSDNYQIAVEDKNGFWYTNINMQIQELMDTDKFVRKCIELGGAQPEFWLIKKYVFFASEILKSNLAGMHNRIILFLQSATISNQYKKKLYKEFLNFYESHKVELSKERNYFLREIYQNLDTFELRGIVFPDLIEEKMYEQAFLFLKLYHWQNVSNDELKTICSSVLYSQQNEMKDFLMNCCLKLIEDDCYTEEIVLLVCQEYTGSLRHMSKAWKAAQIFEIDTSLMEERILRQYLFSVEYVTEIDEIYYNFKSNGGDVPLRTAFINYTAQCYFLEDIFVNSFIFYDIKNMLEEGIELADVCGLAFLKYAASNRDLQMKSESLIGILLEDYIYRDILFPFFKKFDKKYLIKFNIYDRTIIEYRTRKKAVVTIHYNVKDTSETYKSEQMQKVYDSIYVWQTILFFGDEISYYIEESDGVTEQITESKSMCNNDILDDNITGRYDILNAMFSARMLQNNEILKQYVKIYSYYKDMNENEFPIL